MGGGSGGGARRAMAAAGGDGGAGGAEDGGADGGDGPEPTAAPGRAQVFSTVVDTFLEKLVAAGSYQRFVSCYRCFYKLQPQLTRSIYDQFISQLQTSIKEEIQEVKDEGNLEALFSLLDKIVEEAKDREEPAWPPSFSGGKILRKGFSIKDACDMLIPRPFFYSSLLPPSHVTFLLTNLMATA
ncbi:polyamine-modulated factor 1 isoform X3 [Agelaius tricolor]|uniref:polyamine-modulated factor 1 isoform X3 n=1 Tax=Agelaius tricolor TaxID=9191 RepID=UPI0039F1D9D4